MYEVCPENSQPWAMKNRDIYWRRYKIQETLYIGQWCPSPLQSRYIGNSHSSCSISSTVQNPLQNPVLESPSAALSYFPESHQWSEISSLSRVILVLGKARGSRAPNLGCRGVQSPGWFDISSKISAQDVTCEQVHCRDEPGNHQLPIAAAIFIVFHLSTDKEHWGSTSY